MQNTLPPEARLSNAYGLPESDRHEAVLRRFDASLAAKAAKRSERIKTALKRGAAATAVVGAGVVAHNVIPHNDTTASDRPAAASGTPSPDTTVSHPGEPLQIVVKDGDTMSGYAAAIEAQPGNKDLSVQGITEDLIALNGNTARIEHPQGVNLPPYAQDMQPGKGGVQLSPSESAQQ